MKSIAHVLLIPWQLFNCKPKVKDINDSIVEPYEKEICTKLQLDWCNCIQLEGANNCSVIKPFGSFGTANPIANIGVSFKLFGKFVEVRAEPNYLTENQYSPKEKYCVSGPVGATMEPVKPDGARRSSSLTGRCQSGLTFSLQQKGGRTSSKPPEEQSSGTPSLAAMESETASGAVSPGAMAQRQRGFQPQTVFANRRPAVRLALATPAERGRSRDDGENADERGRQMRASNVSKGYLAFTRFSVLFAKRCPIFCMIILAG